MHHEAWLELIPGILFGFPKLLLVLLLRCVFDFSVSSVVQDWDVKISKIRLVGSVRPVINPCVGFVFVLECTDIVKQNEAVVEGEEKGCGRRSGSVRAGRPAVGGHVVKLEVGALNPSAA